MRQFVTTGTKAPSFAGLRPASKLSSLVKQKNRSSDTVPELALRRELQRLGLRFRNNDKALPGKPDVVFRSACVAVFCDGDFWHGRNWTNLKGKLRKGANGTYWHAKIASNMRRDRRDSALLKKSGWRVIRFWETEIRRDAEGLAVQVMNIVRARKLRKN
jgi:DNA mismatch endonuclease, patch repair protein